MGERWTAEHDEFVKVNLTKLATEQKEGESREYLLEKLSHWYQFRFGTERTPLALEKRGRKLLEKIPWADQQSRQLELPEPVETAPVEADPVPPPSSTSLDENSGFRLMLATLLRTEALQKEIRDTLQWIGEILVQERIPEPDGRLEQEVESMPDIPEDPAPPVEAPSAGIQRVLIGMTQADAYDRRT
jgi:hypothetical protein